MPKFKIEMELTSPSERITLADYDSTNNPEALTFEETLNEEENDLKILSFRLPQKFGQNNSLSFSNYIAIGRPIWLTLYNPTRVIRMAISSYSIEPAMENAIYTIEAQDYASFIFARNNAGLTLDTALDEDFWEWLEQYTELPSDEAPGIEDIANHILYRGWLQKRDTTTVTDGWTVEVHLADVEVEPDVFETRSDKVHITISDSNTYNALVELSHISRTFLKFDYVNKVVHFIDKESPSYDKNYILRRGSNLQDMAVNYDGDSLYSLLYVQGGQDEFGLQTIMSDATPYLDNFLYDFTYFKDKMLLSPDDINALEEAINVNLAEINENIIEIIEERYEHLRLINEASARIQVAVERLVEGENLLDYVEDYKDLVSNFYTRDFKLGESITESSSTPWFNAGWESLTTKYDWYYDELPEHPPSNYYLFDYPIRFNYKGMPGILQGPDDIAIIEPEPLEQYLVKIDLSEKQQNETLHGFDAPVININGSVFISTGGDPLTIVSSRGRIFESIEFGTLDDFYPYHSLLDEYDGLNEINKKSEELGKLIDQIKEWWDEDLAEIDEINEKETKTASDEARLALLQSRINDYRRGIGQYHKVEGDTRIYEGDPEGFDVIKGLYTLIKELLDYYTGEYTSEISEPIMKRYRELMKEKQEFWYNLKETYGQHIFLEGYFENNTETSPENLKAQAEAHYIYHNKPNENVSVSYIDISNIIGVNINEIEVGDFIKINEEVIEQEQINNSKLQVAGINRQLREFGNIQLTIFRYNKINNILEKIIASGNR